MATVLISVCLHKHYVDNNAHERAKSNHKESDSYSNRNDMNTAFCLDAKKVGSHIEKKMFVNVDEFFEDNEKYKDLTSLVDAIAKETPDLPVSGQKEFYVSKTAIYYWKPKDNSINKTMVDLFVFSKDKQSIFEYTMLYRNGKFTGGSINKLDVFTTDVIVGFPGESEEEFEKTYKFLDEIKFYKMHIFKYSQRKGTKAAVMQNQIPGDIKELRSRRLIELSNKNEFEINQKYIGKKVEVLFEEEKEGVFKGHTANYILVYCNDEKENLSNKIQEVECIQNLNDHILAKC